MFPETELHAVKAATSFDELEKSIHVALETYSNVHRGSGHNSIVTTQLFDKAREIILDYLGVDKKRYMVVFCTPIGAERIQKQLKEGHYMILSSHDIGLSLGVCAVAVKKKALPEEVPFHTGGGTAKLTSQKWIIWASVPEKFEAGTPQIINVIAFAKALNIIKNSRIDAFENVISEPVHVNDLLYKDELLSYTGKHLLNQLKLKMIGYGKEVPTIHGNKPFVNLDNAASTQTFEPVFESFCKTLRASDQVKREIISEVQDIVCDFLNCPLKEYDIIFTGNTTESVNLIAQDYKGKDWKGIEPVVLGTIMEHTSNDLPWRMFKNESYLRLKVDDDGFIDLKELEQTLILYNQQKESGNKRIKLISITGCSNVLGVCNNFREISRIAHNYDAQVMVDAAQLVAHRQINIRDLGVDYLAFSAHKIYSPFGTGVLITKKGILNFSEEELSQIKQSGEENTAGIASLGKMLLIMQRIGMDVITQEEHILTRKLLCELNTIQGIQVYGIKDTESSNFVHKAGVVVFTHNKLFSNKLGKQLALYGGIGIRFGCHCAHIIVKKLLKLTPPLERIQWGIQKMLPKMQLPGVARVSIGLANNENDIDRFISTLKEITARSHINTDTGKGQVYKQGSVKNQISDFAKEIEEKVYS